MRLREKIECHDRVQGVTVIDEDSQVTGERRWFARDERDLFGFERSEPLHRDRLCSSARRIEKNKIKPRLVEQSDERIYVLSHAANVVESRSNRIFGGELHCDVVVLNGYHLSEFSGQRQREKSDAAE